MRHEFSSQHADQTALGRNEKIEELLLTGLDHYFAARYEQAINVWTRVLFLDRGHARARAYIERARGAVAEGQRESEEMLHGGLAALDRGDVTTARALLESAIDRGGAREDALAVLERVARLESAGASSEAPGPGAPTGRPHTPAGRPIPDRSDPDRRRLWPILAVIVVVLSGLSAWRLWTPRGTLPVPESAAQGAGIADDPLPQTSVAEMALFRAGMLRERGRLHDALQVLDEIGPGDPLRPEADRLRAAIQRVLLAHLAPPGQEPPVDR